MNRRPSLDEYWMRVAEVAATRSTCLRRHVGCVLVDARGHELSTGYNGRPSGLVHCDEWAPSYRSPEPYPHACAGAGMRSGEGLDLCEAVHAEQNALLRCRDVFEIETCYCTTMPCVACAKLLMNTSCREVVYLEEYAPQAAQVAELWSRGGRGRTMRRLERA